MIRMLINFSSLWGQTSQFDSLLSLVLSKPIPFSFSCIKGFPLKWCIFNTVICISMSQKKQMNQVHQQWKYVEEKGSHGLLRKNKKGSRDSLFILPGMSLQTFFPAISVFHISPDKVHFYHVSEGGKIQCNYTFLWHTFHSLSQSWGHKKMNCINFKDI